MKPSIYLETSVIGCLAMRLSGVLRVAANQQVTRDWWDNHRQGFELFVSRYVVDECSGGDPVAAQERLVFLEGVPLLEINEKVKTLADALLARVPLPPKAAIDGTAYFGRRPEWCTIPADVELQTHCQPGTPFSH